MSEAVSAIGMIVAKLISVRRSEGSLVALEMHEYYMISVWLGGQAGQVTAVRSLHVYVQV